MRLIGIFVLLVSLFAAISFPSLAFAGGSLTGALMEKLKDKGVISTADYNEIMGSAPSDDEALSRRLIEKLHEKGVLDDESYAELNHASVEGAAAPSAVAAAEPEPAPQAGPNSTEPTAREAVKPVDKALTAVEEGVAKLAPGVSMKINFFLQTGFISDDAGYSYGIPPTGDYSAADNQFFLRRARLYIGGNVTDKIGYKFSIDPTTPSTILKDAYVYLDYIPYARVTLGQFKVPFGYEGPLALAELPVVNRSMVTNLVHYPTLRDRGVKLSGKYTFRGGDTPLMASYEMAVVNGNGYNAPDDNSQKDVSVRLRFNPMLSCITLGGSYYAGGSLVAGSDRHTERWGAELEWKPKYVKGMKVLAEYLWASRYYDKYLSGAGSPLDRHAHSQGWYVLAAYRLHGFEGGWGFMNGFEPAFRYDWLDEDTHVPDNGRTRTTLGINYYFAKDTRLLLNYEIIRADDALRLNSLEKIDTIDHNLLTTMMQIKF
jgi:phosphate-selective porin